MKRDKIRLLQTLGAIRDGSGIVEKGCGICYNAREHLGFNNSKPMVILFGLFLQWNKHSGSMEYPVPSTRNGVNSGTMYHRSFDLYNKRTKYGQLRLELLDFCIDLLKKELGRE